MASIAQQLESYTSEQRLNGAVGLVDQLEGEFERVVGEIAQLRVHPDIWFPGNNPT